MQCMAQGPACAPPPEAMAALDVAVALDAASKAGGRPSLVWQRAERQCVFDDSPQAHAWWCQHAKISSNCDHIAVLLLSFPPPHPSMVAEEALRRFNGEWLIFIGEWRGCTATAAFFNTLDMEWVVRHSVELPHWPMMDDHAYVLQRL